MKKILILTASFGEGHNSAARGVRDGLARVSPDSIVEMRDIFAEVYGGINERIRRAYLGLINRWPRAWGIVYRWLDRKTDFEADFAKFQRVRAHLSKILETFEPDSVVSTFPAYPYFIRAILGENSRSKNVVVVTDSITVNAIWSRAPGDYFLLPNEQSAAIAAEGGMPADRIKVFGFPVSPKFADLANPQIKSGLPPRVLYMVNAGTRTAPEVVDRLLGDGLNLTVTVGRDERLRGRIERVSSGRQIEIVGWTNEMPRLLSQSDVLIGKAGGATVQETIAASCPMIINHIVAGQEEGNAQLITQTNSGTTADSPADVQAKVRNAFSNDAALWRDWKTNVTRLSRPRASLDIAEFLLSI